MTLEAFLKFLATAFTYAAAWYIFITVAAIVLALVMFFVIMPRENRRFEKRARESRERIEQKWKGW